MNIKIDNLYLCSFASPDLERSKKRFLLQAKKIGIYKVDVNFHSEVKANISVKIDKIQAK